jgi:hypothetical protein
MLAQKLPYSSFSMIETTCLEESLTVQIAQDFHLSSTGQQLVDFLNVVRWKIALSHFSLFCAFKISQLAIGIMQR